MPKYQVQWKDPDAIDQRGHYIWDISDEEELEKLRKLGCDECIVVEFDTDVMTATVRGKND
jgi:FAD synthase